jgi:hypothetical protein
VVPVLARKETQLPGKGCMSQNVFGPYCSMLLLQDDAVAVAVAMAVCGMLA